MNTTSGTQNITVKYDGNKNQTHSNITVSTTVSKNNVTLTVDSINGIIGEDIRLIAHVLDINGNPINGGNLVFKLNGKTLRTDGRFDSNAKVLKSTVKNGIVNITIKADLYLRNAKNLTASYSGSYKYNEAKSNIVKAEIKKRDAKITVTTHPKIQKQYKCISFTATLKDITANSKNTTSINIGTYVIFKLNGKTIKDNKNKNLKVKVVNGKAIYNFTVPKGMGGIDKSGQLRNYTVEALLVSDNYYPDTKNYTNFNVERSPITININKVTLNSKNQLTIHANIKDYKNNYVIGKNNVNLKINGKTYINPKTNNTQNFQVMDGKIDLSKIQVNQNIKIKKISLVTGARQAYLGQRNETINIVKT